MAYGINEVDDVFDNYELELDDHIESLKNKLLTVRAGRANPHVLDGIMADYYGTPTPLNQMANITVSEARMLAISVWDASALKAVEKAIIAANVGINPMNDGKIIRLVFPELTEERRKQLVKEIKTYTENTVIGLRNKRRDINENLKKFKKDNVITEDDLKDMTSDVDGKLSDYIKKSEALFAEKEKEILTAQAINEGKPKEIAEKMVMGRIGKYYKENCLLEQPFVKDDKISVQQYTDSVAKELGAKIKVVAFSRYEKGEGLEKRNDDFAAEVASMAK